MAMGIRIIIFAFFLAIKPSFPQFSNTTCTLNIQLPSPQNNSNCASGNWGGFLTDNCCGSSFNAYLNGLGKRANQTGQIFLNSTQQEDCLASISNCGIAQLTRGIGGCSEYSVQDVVDKLGDEIKSISGDCKLWASNGEQDKACDSCLRRWENMEMSANLETNNICKFAVLVSLVSEGNYDDKGLEAVYSCLGDQNLPTSTTKNDHGAQKQRVQFSMGMWLLIGGLVGIGVLIIVATWMILSRKPAKSQHPIEETKSNDSLSGESSCHKIAVKQVYSATDNLSASNFIGQGIAGKVYKGILSNGQQIAVKHIINDSEMASFVREVTSLSHVRHPNLVTLLAHCEGQDECFLVYELCHKGNLAEWIFGKDKYLSWIQRLEIAIDCARGLWFLHTYPEGCIVHRDIKPTNILICDNFQGKLSDFGLSKVIDMGLSYVSSEVRGTFGYVDPEYQKNNRVNSSGDVYSFGIVLLQLLSGQRVINLDLTKPMPLEKRAKMLTRGGNMTEFVDVKLNGKYSVEAFELVLRLALTCTGIKQQRPSMEQVVSKLEKALDISTEVKSLKPQFTLNIN